MVRRVARVAKSFRDKASARYHVLKKVRIRQNWSKENLYNLAHVQNYSRTGYGTFFQQKWAAKALTRGYHGEHIHERKWNRLFSRYIPSVVPMDARALALQDGNEQAAGRGAGKINDSDPIGLDPKDITPYMQNTFWTMERRLDTAVFRSLFASSARQARQLVVHGHVKVNGRKMVHPSYLLNPGDMFTVDVQRVMHTIGLRGRPAAHLVRAQAIRDGTASKEDIVAEAKRKAAKQAAKQAAQEAQELAEDNAKDKAAAAAEGAAEEVTETEGAEVEDVPAEPLGSINDPVEEAEEDSSSTSSKIYTKNEPCSEEELASRKEWIQDLWDVHEQALKTLAPSAKQKQSLRQISRDLRLLRSRARTIAEADIDAVHGRLDALVAALDQKDTHPSRAHNTSSKPASGADGRRPSADDLASAFAALKTPSDPSHRRHAVSQSSTEHMAALARISRRWRPKNYMAPFAYVPRYLEVNWTVCSAVYLRHPQVRGGLAEVPTPFSPDMSSLAFAYYLRRR